MPCLASGHPSPARYPQRRAAASDKKRHPAPSDEIHPALSRTKQLVAAEGIRSYNAATFKLQFRGISMALGEGVPSALDERLDSWKEIAAYLKREVRTVQRWERLEGLPVHRHQHQKRGSVYALKSELDAWQRRRQLEPNPRPKAASAPPEPPKSQTLPSLLAQPARLLWSRGSVAALFAGFLVLLLATGYLAGRRSRTHTLGHELKPVQGRAAAVVVVGDFNGDGKMDVALARLFSNTISVFFGDSAGGFDSQTSYSIQGTLTGMAAGDFDRDGRSDLAVAADSRRVLILLANGQSSFRQHQEITLPGVSTISAGDIDSNGNVDLVAGGREPASLVVLWGNGDGTFALPQPVSGTAARSAAALLEEQVHWPEQ
jgi:hypothetical protein